jgi:hypothetical protein
MGGVPLAFLLLAARSGSLENSAILRSFNLAPSRARPGTRARQQASDDTAATAQSGDGSAASGLDGARHLEHLAEMRSKGLLTDAEYATAKAAVLRDMEERS